MLVQGILRSINLLTTMFMMHIEDQRVVLISANLVNIVVCSYGMCGVGQITPWELNILCF